MTRLSAFRFLFLRSPDGTAFNPGTAFNLNRRTWISLTLNPGYGPEERFAKTRARNASRDRSRLSAPAIAGGKKTAAPVARTILFTLRRRAGQDDDRSD